MKNNSLKVKINDNKKRKTFLKNQSDKIRNDFAKGISNYLKKRQAADCEAGKKGKDILSQERLAEEWGISPATLSSWIYGTRFPDMDKLIAICDIIGYDIDGLLGRINQRNHDYEFVCSYTGLSSNALDVLRKYKSSEDNDRKYMDFFDSWMQQETEDIKSKNLSAEETERRISLLPKMIPDKIKLDGHPSNKAFFDMINSFVLNEELICCMIRYLYSSDEIVGMAWDSNVDGFGCSNDIKALTINNTPVDMDAIRQLSLFKIRDSLEKIRKENMKEGDPN